MGKAITVLGVVALLVLIYGLSWGIVVGLIKLITMCFGLTFSFSVATGVWLGAILLKFLFNKNNNDK